MVDVWALAGPVDPRIGTSNPSWKRPGALMIGSPRNSVVSVIFTEYSSALYSKIHFLVHSTSTTVSAFPQAKGTPLLYIEVLDLRHRFLA